jgi:ribosomal protein S18 acetylase RimI-like enzyme
MVPNARPLTIRRLVPADALAYRALMLEAYERHPDAFTSSRSERAALPSTWWEARLAVRPQAPDMVLGAFQDNQLAGVAGLSFESREKARHKATLFGMYVPTKFRQRGLGRQLVLAALEQAQARRGVTIVQLTVTHGNTAAQVLYEKCGFVQFGLEPFAVAIGPEFVSKVHMWRSLGS